MRKLFASIAILLPLTTVAQDRKWALQAGFGEVTMNENTADDGRNYVSEDLGNAFYLTGDCYLSDRLALTGGLTYEQQGLFTDFAVGIGLKKVNMLGLQAGMKYYFFPKKWAIQPHVGASVHTNVLNLNHQRGEEPITISEGQQGNARLSYDVQCPAVSIVPRIGVDIHLFSSLSLCIDYDYRFGLWGRSRGELYYTSGQVTGERFHIDERNLRGGPSIGLKMDFPVKPFSDTARNNILSIIHSWISSEAGR